MTSYAPYHSLALEEPSEGRTTARAHRDIARSLSPQNPMRHSTVSNMSANSPKANATGRNSAKNDLTVDSLINKIDGILKQSQSPVKSQSNPLRQSLNFSQPTPINQVSGSAPVAAPALKQSITLDNKAKKIDIFSKKVYDNPLWNNQPVVTNSIRVQTPKPSEKNYELFPIRESPNVSTMSNPPLTQPLNINNDMGDIRSRINDLENKIKTFGSPKSNSDTYATPRGQSVQPATRATSVFATPVPQEAVKRSSPYADRNYISRSVERQRSPSVETNPKKDAEVSEKICQTIDHLIQTHLLSPSKTVPASKSHYSSPPPQPLYSSAINNPLYKSSITIEPVHKSTPHNYETIHEPITYSSPKYDPRPAYESKYEPYSKYESKTESRPAYEPYKPYESSTGYKPYEPKSEARPAYETKYEPYNKYEPTHESRPVYESKYEPYSKYEPKSESRSAYEPYKPYESDNGYPKSIYESKYESRPAYEPYESFKSYDPLPSYERDFKPYSSDSYVPSSVDHDRHRPRYVRPLHRNSPPRYSSYSNWSSPKMDYISPRQSDYYNTDDIYSLLTTPVKGQPQDSTSTDKKLKKLTLKSKVSEEKDDNKKHGKKQDFKSGDLQSDNEHHDADALPLPAGNRAKAPKTHKKGKSIALDEKPLYNNGNIRQRNYKAGELLPDDEFHAGGLLGDETPRENYRAGELSDDSVDTEVGERDYEEEREIGKEGQRQKPKHNLRQSRISKDIPDDGKAWNMVHKLPSSVFEEEESGFDFSQPEPKSEKKQPPRQNKPKAMLWTMDESAPVSQRGSVSNLSDSVRRSQRKPVLAHCFDRAERGGY